MLGKTLGCKLHYSLRFATTTSRNCDKARDFHKAWHFDFSETNHRGGFDRWTSYLQKENYDNLKPSRYTFAPIISL